MNTSFDSHALLGSKPCFRLLNLTLNLVVMVSFCCVALLTEAQGQRVWTSKNGAFQKQATLVETKQGKVVLELEDGRTIEVAIEKLSAKDQRHIASLADSENGDHVDPVVSLRGAKLGAAIETRITDFHQGQEKSGEVLRVVYFHGSDSKPQVGYQARLDRNFKDIQDFYHVEMQENGFRSTQKIPLELEGGKLVVHVVAGKDPTRSYSAAAASAIKIRNECKVALRGKVDFGSDYVVIICGLVKMNGQKYVFNAPNYALPCDHNFGCSFVHDCDKFDVDLLKDTRSTISYSKEGKQFVETFAKYNTRRLGATAHEAGHALNLPHNSQTKQELSRQGRALMGNGNQVYRRQLWDRGRKGAFLTLATATKLAAHPLLTGSNRDRWKVAKCEFDSINYSLKGKRLEIKGKLRSVVPALAVIAYSDPAEVDIRDYDATSWVGGVGDDGSFQVTVGKHVSGQHELRLAVLLANGATKVPVAIQYGVDKKGVPDVAKLNATQWVGPIERLLAFGKDAAAGAAAGELLKKLETSGEPPAEELLEQLRHIVTLAEPEKIKLRSLSDVEADSVFLSEVEWERAEAGYGEPARDRVLMTPQQLAKNKTAVLLQVGGRFHKRGLYAHVNSSFVFTLDGKWSTFEGAVGLQVGANGRDEFIIKGDGRELFRSKEISGSIAENFKVNVTGVKKLELIAQAWSRAKGGGWAVWASPMLKR